ncbi:uncharacterized protein PHALS_12934 [Plasmopara halstedii]|uniref:DDE-1 domain-containing protein n=1 Tax=Plasmopara halstedii TaxID=4781 RepID=A0A0P1ANE3_PLAHL|nr:uncharacterized protein PHALS_12934 [Plasmopara halstedii]CEG42680.1 hypothetical protein PHALS_12934 [Plasmopara halstedii]|eukprot:XP_024579049.1 hypothetical protein PHALS_12934 [Plasmopara halstedii]
MGIIAAMKKRYEYLYLKDVLGFYELDDDSKAHKKEQAARLARGSAGVVYGKPAHLLDAAQYVQRAWESVSALSIRNAFKKAEIMTLEDSGNEDEEDFMGEIIDNFASLDIQIERSKLEEFLHIDDESSEEYSKAVLEDVE